MIKSILKFKGWKNDRLNVDFEDSCLKCLEEIASKYHNEINFINAYIGIGFYAIKTVMTGSEKNQHYKLKVKVKYYDDKSKHEHKKNTHRQKINI